MPMRQVGCHASTHLVLEHFQPLERALYSFELVLPLSSPALLEACLDSSHLFVRTFAGCPVRLAHALDGHAEQ